MPFDVLAGLRRFERTSKRTGKTSIKVGIEIRAGKLLFDPQDKATARALSLAVRDRIASSLRAGRRPDGAPMPPITEATKEWREDEAAQARNSGRPVRKVNDPKFVARAQRNFQRDYTAPRLGKFTPVEGGPRGVLSGMLAESFLVRPGRDGQSFVVYVAAKRGRPRPGEQLSAIESVFRDVPVWNKAAMETPELKQALQAAADRMFAKSSAKFLKEAAEALRNLRDLAGEFEE